MLPLRTILCYHYAPFYATITQRLTIPFRVNRDKRPHLHLSMSLPPHSNIGRPYTPRVIDDELDRLLAGLGAVSLEGAKAVGKTATAMRRAARTMRLDRPAVAQVVSADPDEAVRPPYPVFFDEWQHVPAIWDAVRRRVDDDPTPGLAILAG